MTPGGSSSPFCSFSIFLADDLAQHVDLARGHLFDFVDLLVDARVLVGELDALQVAGRDALDGLAVEHHALGQQALVGALVVQVGQHFLAAQQASKRFKRSSVRIRISSDRFFSSRSICCASIVLARSSFS